MVRAQAAAPAAMDEGTADAAPLRAGSGAIVLVIDDTDTNRELAARQLRQSGLVCEAAENGLVGLEMTETRRYALILVDGSMPVMDGLEFARRFREREQQRGDVRTPIVAVTAHALAGDAQRFLSAGMDDYVAKPVTLDKLRGTLAKWLPDAAGLPPPAPPPGDAPEPEQFLDCEALAAMLGDDDPAAIAEMVAIFRADFAALLERVQEALTEGDRPALARAAHAAKSAAGSAAAKSLASRLAQLETLAPAAEAEVLTALVKAVALDFARLEAEADERTVRSAAG
jgi:CheY-like chemotaxis protein